jgi:hypothetical protein
MLLMLACCFVSFKVNNVVFDYLEVPQRATNAVGGTSATVHSNQYSLLPTPMAQ